MLKRLLLFLIKNNIKKYLLVVLGTFSWSLTMIRSSLCWDTGCKGGLGFWGANGHDGIWHIALAGGLSRGDWSMPIFAGSGIQNYHIGFDLILAFLHKITSIPIQNLYFQILPPIFALLIGLFTYRFIENWQRSKRAAWWSTFFVYFGGSFGWLVSLARGQGLGGESMFWAQQSISTLINPPFALSLAIILAGLIYFKKYLDKKSKVDFCLAILFFGVSIFIKVYAGLLVLTALLAAGTFSLIIKHESSVIKVFLGSLVISSFLFIPFNKLSVGLISYSPFWFLESMMALSDRVGWQKMYSAMTTYRMGDIWLKAILAYGLVFVIFVVGNFGTRIVSFVSFFKKPKELFKSGPIDIFVFTLILAGITVPMFFVQKGTPWNTIQFFYYSLFFAGILAGVYLGHLIETNNSRLNTSILYSIEVMIILLTVPTTICSLGNYISKTPHSTLPKSELEALNFLNKEPSGTVLTYPYAKENSTNSPIPLYLYTTTAYVSAYSGKPVFLEDEMNLGIMQYDFQERRNSVKNFLNTLDVESARNFLRENNIAYVYWLKDQRARVGDLQLGLTLIFENENVTIYAVNR